jgi:hypothetical protein
MRGDAAITLPVRGLRAASKTGLLKQPKQTSGIPRCLPAHMVVEEQHACLGGIDEATESLINPRP